MKFSVNKKLMLGHVKSANKVILAKNPLPILDTIHVELKEDVMYLTSGDEQNIITQSLTVDNTDGAVDICVNGKQLEAALTALDGNEASFKVDGNMLTVYADKEYYNIPIESSEEYPSTPKISEESSRYVLPSDIIAEACRICKPYVANDELRPVMNGIYFDASPEGITFVATDGHRMIRRTYKNVNSEVRSGIIVPMKTASLLAIFPPETPVTVTSNGNHTVFEGAGICLTARCIDGRYPNYNAVIPSSNPYKVEVDRAKLSKIIADVSGFGSYATNLIKLRLSTFMGDIKELEVSAQVIDFSLSASKTMAVIHDTPENFAIGLKGDFVRSMLASHASQSVIIELADPSRAVVMRDKTPSEEVDMLTMLMPMMLQD